jgi:hypothetical protein
MSRAKVPRDVRIMVEVGSQRPEEVSFDPIEPFKMLWVITNGSEQRRLLWVTARKTGIYVAHGGPSSFHTSYHTNGTVNWKIAKQKIHVEKRQPLPEIREPVSVQSATIMINDEALARFDLRKFTDNPVDRLVYLDNRVLPEAINYNVWAVPPFKHGEVPLMTEWPAHIHVVTHTVPWIEVIIYEQGKHRDLKRLHPNHI